RMIPSAAVMGTPSARGDSQVERPISSRLPTKTVVRMAAVTMSAGRAPRARRPALAAAKTRRAGTAIAFGWLKARRRALAIGKTPGASAQGRESAGGALTVSWSIWRSPLHFVARPRCAGRRVERVESHQASEGMLALCLRAVATEIDRRADRRATSRL